MLPTSDAGQQLLYCCIMDIQPPMSSYQSSMCPRAYVDLAPKVRGFKFIARSGPGQSGSNNDNMDENEGKRLSVDWDKAWSTFRKQGKKKLFSQFNLEKYVSRNPTPSNYPLDEEIDPLRRSERSVLGFWTNPQFQLAVFGIIVGLLIFYIVVK